VRHGSTEKCGGMYGSLRDEINGNGRSWWRFSSFDCAVA